MLIDTHCHLYDDKFENAKEIIDNFEKDNIKSCICCGDTMENSIKVLNLAKNDRIYAAIGVHPETADNYSIKVEEFIKDNATNPKVVAVGEIGLDYYHEFCERNLQKEVFIKQIKLAHKLKLPMVIHIREAYGDFLEILKELSLSNNEVILVDTGKTKEIHKLLANRIIKKEDFEKESF